MATRRDTLDSASGEGGLNSDATPGEKPELVVTELPPASPPAPTAVRREAAGHEISDSGGRAGATPSAIAERAGVRHLRVARRSSEHDPAAVEVWVDPELELTPKALAALEALEETALAGPSRGAEAAPAPGQYLAAARRQAAGALPVRTVRAAAVVDGRAVGSVEDIVTGLERLERFPADLASVPEGLRRVPHPLEATVRFLQEEARRNAVMAGEASSDDR